MIRQELHATVDPTALQRLDCGRYPLLLQSVAGGNALSRWDILFIASGAFHVAKPSDMLPELQGRLPIRVELQALTEADFVRILTETDNALTRQYTALMGAEGVVVNFTEEGIAALAKIAAQVNLSVENIGARRLRTVMERILDDVSFTAPDRDGETLEIDGEYVRKSIGDLAKNADLSRFIL